MSKKKLNLSIPENLNEEELIKTIKEAARPHIIKYTFPGHTSEDMMQLAIMYGIDASHRWDGVRSLKNFLSIHIRNRLYNYRRENYIRMETPCGKCPLKAFIRPNKCKIYDNRLDCELFKNWNDKNLERKNINDAIGFDVVSDINEESMKLYPDLDFEIDTAELLELIDQNIDINYRQDYLVLMNGGKLPGLRLTALRNHIHEIVCQKKPEH